ncbi:MAG: hypothetical protein LBQ81_13725 [Zoogloeaceae bacterium]|jgi:phosphatidylserine decarboxylase|nr:hypothetical protein [Zoogloeaceae bacterium]
MPDYPHPLIAKEGWPFIAISFALALGATLLFAPAVAFIFGVIFIFVLQFFRDPPLASFWQLFVADIHVHCCKS